MLSYRNWFYYKTYDNLKELEEKVEYFVISMSDDKGGEKQE